METGVKPIPAPLLISVKINIKLIKLNMMMWPAVMFANKRTISAKGLVNTPNSSTGIINIFTGKGTPGNQKMCCQ